MQKLIIANWKMNFLLEDAENYCTKLTQKIFDSRIIIAAPSLYLSALSQKYKDINFAAQNLSHHSCDYGAYTGEISAKMIANIGINYAIMGHSESRANFEEADLDIRNKAIFALKENVTPIICIGESAKVRDESRTESFILNQLLSSIPETDKELIIAYEPIWAIGSGIFPSHIEMVRIFTIIKENITKVAKKARLVYGGSVTSEVVSELTSNIYIDGILVGGASLNIEEFIKIIKTYA